MDFIITIITHRRNKWHMILLVLFAAVLFALAKSEMINLAGTLVCAAIWCLYLSVCVLSMRPKTRVNHPVLRRYGKMLDAGLSFEVSAFFKKEKHAFLLDLDERLEYTILRSKFYSEVGNFEKSYKLLAEIEEKYLYREENVYCIYERHCWGFMFSRHFRAYFVDILLLLLYNNNII